MGTASGRCSAGRGEGGDLGRVEPRRRDFFGFADVELSDSGVGGGFARSSSIATSPAGEEGWEERPAGVPIDAGGGSSSARGRGGSVCARWARVSRGGVAAGNVSWR